MQSRGAGHPCGTGKAPLVAAWFGLESPYRRASSPISIMLYLATALGLAMAPPHGRTLSYTGILNYQPGSQVTDHASKLFPPPHVNTHARFCSVLGCSSQS